jgi:hypothetical protein
MTVLQPTYQLVMLQSSWDSMADQQFVKGRTFS